jgi:hypothetical protein
MQPVVRRTKKMARRSVLNTAKKAAQAEKMILAEPSSHSTGRRDEEELVHYESEVQPSFSPAEDISEPEDRLRTPVPGQDGSSSPDYDLGDVAADDAPMAGQKRRPNSPEDEQRRKAPKDGSAASLRKDAQSTSCPLQDAYPPPYQVGAAVTLV